MGFGRRLLALCKREDQVEDNRGKVCLATGEKYEIEFRQNLKVRDVCIEVAKSLNIAPVALDFFTLMTTDCENCLHPNHQGKQVCVKEKDHYLNPKRLLHAEEVASKVFFFRLSFKAIPGPDIKNVDKGAYEYFLLQCRWDYLNGRITGLVKKDYLTLLVLESIIRGHEYNVTGKDVLDNPKKFGIQHMFDFDPEFSFREIKNHLKKQIPRFKTCAEDVNKAKNSFLCVLESVEDFGITKIVVTKFYVNVSSQSSNDEVHQVEWEILISADGLKKRRTYKDEGDFDSAQRGPPDCPKDEIITNYKDIEYIEIKQSESAEIIHISRLKGSPEVISVSKSMIKKESLITLIEGFYRLLVNQYKALTKYEAGLELPIPNPQRKEVEIHGPIERKKAETLLKAVDGPNGSKLGVHMIRRSRMRYDCYILSFICGENEIRHYEVPISPTTCKYGIENGPQFDNLVQMLEHYKTAQGCFPALKKYCPIPRDGLCALFDEQIVLEPPHPPSSSRPVNPEYQFVQIGNMQLEKLNHTFEHGNFGERVFKARWLKFEDGGYQEVFCRQLAPLRSPDSKERVIKSSEKMASLVHRNLVPFLGVCFYNGQNTYLVFEWMSAGTLDDYLLKNKDVTVENLITFAAQISEACMYLHQSNYKHGWLAAHNVLVVSDEQVKVSDVSVPCLREEELLPTTDEINRSPWKARECFQSRPYSKESDVWAFGVVLWEMFTKTKPFKNMTDDQILEVFQRDHHLANPKCCPADVCTIMKACWKTEPARRPTFANIVTKLRSISSTLSLEEKQRKIPPKIDERFALEPLLANKASPVPRVEDESEMPSTSSAYSGDDPDDGDAKDHQPSKETLNEHVVGSSADIKELDLIPQKDTQHNIVWTPEEIEMKDLQRKRAIPIQYYGNDIYNRFSQEEPVIPSSEEEVMDGASNDEIHSEPSELSTEDEPLIGQNPSPKNDQPKRAYLPLSDLDHVGFLACQFGPVDATEEQQLHQQASGVDSGTSEDDSGAAVDDLGTFGNDCGTLEDKVGRSGSEPNIESTSYSDDNSVFPIHNLDPFAANSEETAALVFGNLSRDGKEVQSKTQTTDKQPLRLNYMDTTSQPVRLNGLSSSKGNSFSYVKPLTDKNLSKSHPASVRHQQVPGNPASGTAGFLSFSELDPFACMEEPSSPTECASLLGDENKATEAILKQSVKETSSSNFMNNAQNEQPALFSSFLQRDPFSEILSDNQPTSVSLTNPETGGTNSWENVSQAHTTSCVKKSEYDVSPSSLLNVANTSGSSGSRSSGYVGVHQIQRLNAGSSSQSYVPARDRLAEKRNVVSERKPKIPPRLQTYSERDPFADILSKGNDGVTVDERPPQNTTHLHNYGSKQIAQNEQCAQIMQSKPQTQLMQNRSQGQIMQNRFQPRNVLNAKSTPSYKHILSNTASYQHVQSLGPAPKTNFNTASGYKKTKNKILSDSTTSNTSPPRKEFPIHSINESEIGNLSERDIFSDILRNTSSSEAPTTNHDTSRSESPPNDKSGGGMLIKTQEAETDDFSKHVINDEVTKSSHATSYLTLSFHDMDPFREIQNENTSCVDVKMPTQSAQPVGVDTTQLQMTSDIESKKTENGATRNEAVDPSEGLENLSFETRDPFAEMMSSRNDVAKRNTNEAGSHGVEAPSDTVKQEVGHVGENSDAIPHLTNVTLVENKSQDNQSKSSDHMPTKHSPLTNEAENPYVTRETARDVSRGQPPNVSRGEYRDVPHDKTQHVPHEESPTGNRTSPRGSPPDQNPGGSNQVPEKPPISRKSSDITSGYAKVSICPTGNGPHLYQTVVAPEESVQTNQTGGAEGGEIETPYESGNKLAGGYAGQGRLSRDTEETVHVDPFNISAAEKSIQNLETYRSENAIKSGLKKAEAFEESMKTHLIPYSTLTFNDKENVLGEGAFGVVRRAKLTRVAQHKTRASTDVAVKCLKENASEIYKNSFKQEAINLMRLDHMFIVRFLGISYDDQDKLLLVTELVPQGSLHKYLKDPKNLKILGNEVLLQFAIQITTGMEYLESKKLVHRDLAARNILVASESQVKISDFGLSRIYADDYYRSTRENQRLPIRWLPPECLEQKKFTVYSDVWSLGVTLWEMFSYGRRPYDDMNFKNATEFIEYLKGGERLKKPKACIEEIFGFVQECWLIEPAKRISFFLLKTFLENILKDKYQKTPYFM